MLRANPKYILKNHILQEVIKKAQENDFTMVNDLIKVAHTLFDEHKELKICIKNDVKFNDWIRELAYEELAD